MINPPSRRSSPPPRLPQRLIDQIVRGIEKDLRALFKGHYGMSSVKLYPKKTSSDADRPEEDGSKETVSEEAATESLRCFCPGSVSVPLELTVRFVGGNVYDISCLIEDPRAVPQPEGTKEIDRSCEWSDTVCSKTLDKEGIPRIAAQISAILRDTMVRGAGAAVLKA